jgi:TRAP-type C4-dicarboxylate transport system substrate-binding protein
MLEPLLMSKKVFDALTPAQQKAVTDVGLELETFATASAKEDDEAVAAVYRKVNAKVVDMDDAVVNRWRKIAEEAAWTDFSKRSADCDRFLKMAKAVA